VAVVLRIRGWEKLNVQGGKRANLEQQIIRLMCITQRQKEQQLFSGLDELP
jgi:hypothetical protein